jgi:ATP-dependent RNA helicase DDX21
MAVDDSASKKAKRKQLKAAEAEAAAAAGVSSGKKEKKEKKDKKRKAKEPSSSDESSTSSESEQASKKAKKEKKAKKVQIEEAEEEANDDDGELTASGEDEPAADPNAIDNFRISEPLKLKLRAKGINALFPIQATTFGLLLDGNDLVGRARTGQVR